MLEVVVYAVIAVFIVSKLYNVLGRGANVVVNLKTIEYDREVDDEVAKYPKFKPVFDVIIKKDNSFSLKDFIDGAERAFEVIIGAMNKNDIQSVESLISKDLYGKLRAKIQNHIDKNELHEVTIISIKSKEVQMVNLVKNNINITVKFISEKIKLVRNMTTNEVIKGDISATELAEDIWSFTRNIKSNSKKWLLSQAV